MAIVVLVLTLAPWAYFVFFFAHFMAKLPMDPSAAAPPAEFFQAFNTIFRLQLIIMASLIGLLVFYIVHVFRTDRVPADKKALWAVVLFLGHLLAMPVYWYLYMWPKSDEGSRLTSA